VGIVETFLIVFAAATEFQENKFGDDITVVGGRGTCDFAFFLEFARNPIQRLVGKIIGGKTIPPVEVTRQPAAHFEIPIPIGVNASVQPVEEFSECLGV
jgi:hypothetical protein